ncbi:PID-CTERM protein-sorting domain-containing protein [Hymenobacter sp. APR13]|uniref:PID-CTERM protein-sorting domain-containing protein n=1 Tax=Hymenobacter sp. APR13 TaxID=1356852 RepID=UPI0004E043A2|nr:hypothetical protein [Hymenobacter sp. APR13]AII53755.1 hypothetical protein N008_17455 [Hymenobacter sp. APR13]
MKRSLFTLTLTLALVGGTSRAQGPGSGGPVPGPAPEPTAVPIDGGASLLAAGAVAYGLRAMRRRRR